MSTSRTRIPPRAMPFAPRGCRRRRSQAQQPGQATTTKQRVRGETDQHRRRENRAQHVLRPLAVGGARPQLFADLLPGTAQPRTQHERAASERDAKP